MRVVSVVIDLVLQITPKKHVSLVMWQSRMRCHGRQGALNKQLQHLREVKVLRWKEQKSSPSN